MEQLLLEILETQRKILACMEANIKFKPGYMLHEEAKTGHEYRGRFEGGVMSPEEQQAAGATVVHGRGDCWPG